VHSINCHACAFPSCGKLKSLQREGRAKSDKNTSPKENPPRGGPHEGLGVDNSGFADLN